MKHKDYKDLWSEIEKSGWMDDFIAKIFTKISDSKVSNYKPAQTLKSEMDFSLAKNPSDFNTIKSELLNYMDQAVNTQSPYFVNQLYGGAHPIAVISEWVNAFMNTSMATYEIAPLASLYESEIIKSLGDLMSWETPDGLMVPGGSYANMMALHLARFHKNPASKTEGHSLKHIVYISDQAHYSVKKAAHLLGYGEDQVRIVPSDSYFKMNIYELEFMINEDLKSGFTPTLIVSTLGTTVFGAIDPIGDIQNISTKYKLWHHVDGAWGGPLVFTRTDIQNELKYVDSVTYDFHKLLGGTLTKAIFITNREGLLSKANSCVGTQYIFHEDEDSFFDTGTKAIQCGRKVDALSLWMTWKYLGNTGFKSYVDGLMELKDQAVKLVNQYEYTMLHEPEYLNICFQVPLTNKHASVEQVNHFQKSLRRQLVKEGKVFVNYSSTEQHGVFIRLVLNHLRLDEKVLADIFKIIDDTAYYLNLKSVNFIDL